MKKKITYNTYISRAGRRLLITSLVGLQDRNFFYFLDLFIYSPIVSLLGLSHVSGTMLSAWN